MGGNSGADFIWQAFEPQEFIARVEALLRRPRLSYRRAFVGNVPNFASAPTRSRGRQQGSPSPPRSLILEAPSDATRPRRPRASLVPSVLSFDDESSPSA